MAVPEPSQPSAVTKVRYAWMDVLRGTAMFLLILFHSTAIVALYGEVLPRWLVVFNEVFLPFRMPTLMLLSGMLLAGSLRKPLPVYYWGKIKMIAYPYILWTVVHSVDYGLPWPLYNPKAWIATGYLWYLFYIGVFYALAPLLRRVHPLIIVVAAWLGTIPLSVPVQKRFLFLAGFFFLGSFIQNHRDAFERLVRSRLTFFVVPPAIAFALISAINGPYRYEGMFAVFSVAGTVGLARFAMACQHQSWTRLVRYVGRNSIIFYTTHFPIIIGVIFITRTWWHAPLVVTAPADFVVAVLLGLGLSYLAARGPVKYLFEAPDPFSATLAANAAPRARALQPAAATGQPAAAPGQSVAATGQPVLPGRHRAR